MHAVALFRMAAEQGVLATHLNLGNCYHSGEGVMRELAQAVAWYRKAAEQGIVEAQYNLGMCYTALRRTASRGVMAPQSR